MAENQSNNRSRGSAKSGSTGGRPAAGPGRGPGGGGPGGHGRFGPVQKAKDVRGTLLRLTGYLLHYKGALALTIVLVALSSGLGVLGPYLMGVAIDSYILGSDLPGLVPVLGLMVAVYVVGSGVVWLQTIVMISASQKTIRDLRNDLFSSLQTLSLRYFDQHTHGELMSRLSNDVDNVSMVLSNAVTQLVSSALSVTGVAAMMFVINWRLALVSLITIPLMMVLTQLVAKQTRKGFRDQQQYLGDLNGMIEETVTGQQVVKAYAREEAEISRFAASNVLLRKASVKAQIFGGFVGPMMNFVNNLSFAIVAGAGGWMAVQGLATVGTIASFVNYARQFARPLNQIAGLYNQIQSALAGAERVFEVMDEVPEVQDAPDAVSLTEVAGDVVFDDVSFGYDTDVPVLENVSLYARPGQTIALVGPTGAGKTTIVNLLTRFYDIQSGSVTIDGVDIRQIKTADLRRQLGIVLQDTFLFGDTVMENIRYGRLEATDDEVIAAAKMANADEFVRHLPEKYQAELTENGSNLSQGQRQLLAIARAILADPGILILDEATSSVDTRTEQHIQEAMLRLMSGRTSFVIAHRLSTIREADAIMVINAGKIVERGSHDDLISAGGFYYDLHMSQYRGEAMPMGEMMSGD
ncbi:MAG: ABC transporter ATP-binding protein/permease [Anaerolineae bacterium]|nr:ABC transporter ATP-binding protein/permease [Anaerolineae bacterium]